MFWAQAQSGETGGVIDSIGEAVGGTPWVVVALLIAMIGTGVVLLVSRVRSNKASGEGGFGQ